MSFWKILIITYNHKDKSEAGIRLNQADLIGSVTDFQPFQASRSLFCVAGVKPVKPAAVVSAGST